MKRFILVISLVLSVLLLITACTNDNNTKPQGQDSNNKTVNSEPIESNNKTTPQLPTTAGGRLAQSYIDLMKSENYTMKYKTFVDVEGEIMESNNTLSVKVGERAIRSDNDDYSSHIIIKEDSAYIINHENEMVIMMSFDMTADEQNLIDPSEIDVFNMDYIGSGTKEFFENLREYEEYDTTHGKILYFFDGKNLMGMEMEYDGEVFKMLIEEITAHVDEKLFEIPSGYEILDYESLLKGGN